MKQIHCSNCGKKNSILADDTNFKCDRCGQDNFIISSLFRYVIVSEDTFVRMKAISQKVNIMPEALISPIVDLISGVIELVLLFRRIK